MKSITEQHAPAARANRRILSGLSEGQVLQRLGPKGASVALSGTCPNSGPLAVTIASKNGILKGWKNRAVGRAAKGKFTLELAGIPAGGPYRLDLRGGGITARVREFFVGDVWLIAGQSNAQGVGNMSEAPRPHPLIRSFSMRREWMRAEEPLHLLGESPDFCHNGARQCAPEESARLRRSNGKGVGPGLWFAREMLDRSGVPQGLICTAHGGTSMSQWSPVREIDGKTSLYGSLMDSVEATGQPVAGVLWYQGESDANAQAAPLYTGRMRKLVAALRKDLRQPGLPWLTVQIARVFGKRPAADEAAWNQVQEQQRLLPRAIKNLSVVAAVDLPLDDFVHISGAGQARLAARLAREADRLAHGNRRETSPPQLLSVSSSRLLKTVPPINSHVVDVVFKDVVGGLRAVGEPTGFVLVDPDGCDLRAIYKTTLHGNTARLHLISVFQNALLCHGIGSSPICNITDGRDHALPVFGPQPLGQPKVWLPFVKQWKVTPPVPSPLPLDRIDIPDVDALGAEVKTYGENEFNLDGFINEHPRWSGADGHGYFAALVKLPEPMRLEFLMGYDGPFRLWLDRKPFFTNMEGRNPCFPDESSKVATLAAGTHAIHVAMDIKHGAAWGFFLRFVRKDIPLARIKAGHFSKPVYGV
ncbi:MAG: sialate O-acetylesterase [Terrimicrobiaceae bacterium]